MKTKIITLVLLFSIHTIFSSQQSDSTKERLDTYDNSKIILPLSYQDEMNKNTITTDRNGNIYVLSAVLSLSKQYPPSVSVTHYNPENTTTPSKPLSHPYDLIKEIHQSSFDAYNLEPVYTGNPQEQRKAWLKNPQLTNKLAIGPNNSCITTYQSGGFNLWSDNETQTFAIPNSISAIAIHPSSNTNVVAVGSYNGEIHILNLAKEEQSYRYARNFEKYEKDKPKYPEIIGGIIETNNPISSLFYSLDGNSIICVAGTQCFQVSINTRKPNKSTTGQLFDTECTIIASAYLTGSESIALISQNELNYTIDLFDVKTKTSISTNVLAECGLTSICGYTTAQGETFLVTGGLNKEVIIWQLQNNQITRHITIPQGHPVYEIAISKDKYIVVKTIKTHADGSMQNFIICYPTPTHLKTIQSFKERCASFIQAHKNKLFYVAAFLSVPLFIGLLAYLMPKKYITS